MSASSREAAETIAEETPAPASGRPAVGGWSTAPSRGARGPSAALDLQRSAGNRATRAWLARSPAPAASVRAAPATSTATATATQATQVRSGDRDVLAAGGEHLRRAVGERRLARTPADDAPAIDLAESAPAELANAALSPVSAALKGPFNLTDKCVAPMALGGPMYRDAWGILAHAFISTDYEDVMGVPRGTDLYLDDSFAGPIDPRYAAFLIRKNPSVPSWVKVALALTSIKRADAVLHTTTNQELDEFKPDNVFGIVAGHAKLAQILAYCKVFGLPYNLGTSYTPTPMTRIFTIAVAGIPVELWLQVRREASGLIVYKYCIRTDWGLLAWGAVIAAILLAIYLILKGRVPAPAPPGPPPELPAPNPIPIPIPAPPIPVPVPAEAPG